MDNDLQNAREQARQAQKQREALRKQAHAKVVVLLRGRRTGPVVVRYALKQVAKWRKNHLCSQDYINDWSDLLRRPKQAADLLLEDSQKAMRLRQNSPFAAYLQK